MNIRPNHQIAPIGFKGVLHVLTDPIEIEWLHQSNGWSFVGQGDFVGYIEFLEEEDNFAVLVPVAVVVKSGLLKLIVGWNNLLVSPKGWNEARCMRVAREIIQESVTTPEALAEKYGLILRKESPDVHHHQLQD